MFVSVCMACYNGENYIKEQITSILIQLGENGELIISDDFSQDRTSEIVKSFNDDRIILLENKTRLGLIKNFEKALQVSKGDYIFLSDHDDIWLDNKVEVFLEYLKLYDVVQADAAVVNSKLEVLYPSYFELMGSDTGLIKNIWKNNYIGCNMAFNRRVLEIALPFPKDIPMHDMWIGITGEFLFKTFFIPDKLLLYRRHNSNASQTGFKSPFTFKQKIKFRMNVIKYFPLLIKRKFVWNGKTNS